VVLVTGTRLPDVYALSRRTPSLRTDLAASQDDESLCILTVGEGRPYSNREIEVSLGMRVVSSLAWDPVSADVYAVGAPPGRRFESSPLTRTAAATAITLSALVRDRRERIAPAPQAPEPEERRA
jgi:hypothetical protein